VRFDAVRALKNPGTGALRILRILFYFRMKAPVLRVESELIGSAVNVSTGIME
jgi:hypothetical protein